jgi:hypothetical protein
VGGKSVATSNLLWFLCFSQNSVLLKRFEVVELREAGIRGWRLLRWSAPSGRDLFIARGGDYSLWRILRLHKRSPDGFKRPAMYLGELAPIYS